MSDFDCNSAYVTQKFLTRYTTGTNIDSYMKMKYKGCKKVTSMDDGKLL